MPYPTRLTVALAATCVLAATILPAQTTRFAEDFESVHYVNGQRNDLRASQFRRALQGWDHPDYWAPLICACDDPRTAATDYVRTCLGYPAPAHSGCRQLLMSYAERRRPAGMLDDTTSAPWAWGGSTYLTRTLDAPLELGHVYRLSLWVNLRRDARADPLTVDSIARHIGVQFFHQPVLAEPFGSLYLGAQLAIDTVRYDEWYELSWTFKPLCELNYLAIGVFRNAAGPPYPKSDTDPGYDLNYFLDDVRLEELPADTAALTAATGVCRFDDEALSNTRPVPPVGSVTAYFATGSTSLRDSARAALDTFAAAARRSPTLTFFATGHADPRGSDTARPGNQALSAARVDAVLAYLDSAYRIAPFRFVRVGYGSSRSQGGTLALDRRVELDALRDVPWPVPYRYALEQGRAGDAAGGLRALRMWLATAPVRQLALLAYDPRAAPLRTHPAYAAFAKAIRSRTRTGAHAALTATLDSLYFEDQRYRTLAPRIENLAYYVAERDTLDAWWSVHFPVDSLGWVANDARNAAAAARLVEAHGWPKVSEVGARAASAVPLALIHSEDPALMAKYLPAFAAACRAGEGDWAYFAMLTDRRLVNLGEPQEYGTQFHEVGTPAAPRAEPWPVREEAGLARRRAALGLE